MRRKLMMLGKILILLLPLILVFYLYPTTERVIFNGIDYQQTEFRIDNLFQEKPTFKNLSADIFSVPLFLDWYKVSITNNSIQKDPNCLINEPPIIRFSFYKGDPRTFGTNLVEGELETKHSIYESKYPDYHLTSGDTAYFIAPSWEKYSINGGLLFGGDCELGTLRLPGDDFKISELSYDYDISIKPHWPSWIVRLIVVYIFWMFVLSAIFSIRDWLKK